MSWLPIKLPLETKLIKNLTTEGDRTSLHNTSNNTVSNVTKGLNFTNVKQFKRANFRIDLGSYNKKNSSMRQFWIKERCNLTYYLCLHVQNWNEQNCEFPHKSSMKSIGASEILHAIMWSSQLSIHNKLVLTRVRWNYKLINSF